MNVINLDDYRKGPDPTATVILSTAGATIGRFIGRNIPEKETLALVGFLVGFMIGSSYEYAKEVKPFTYTVTR